MHFVNSVEVSGSMHWSPSCVWTKKDDLSLPATQDLSHLYVDNQSEHLPCGQFYLI